MNTNINYPLSSESSLWIQNLVYGLSGLTIKARNPVFCASSPFQKIEVYDTYSFGLVLCLGGTIVLTERDNHVYHEMMIHPAMLMHKAPKKICIVGGGDGGCLREVLKYPGIEQVVIVEIDSMVKDTVTHHFPALAKGFGDPRVNVVIEDGCNFLKQDTGSYDLIYVDSYDPSGPVQSLETADFHNFVAERLDQNGIAVFQTDSPILRKEYVRQAALSLSPLFPQIKPYICAMPSFPEGICSFLVCSKTKGRLDNFDKQRYEIIAEKCSYYNAEMQTGAFLLPQYIKKIFQG